MWPTIRTVGSQETKRWGRIWATRLPRDQSLCMLSPSSQAPDQPLLQLSAPRRPRAQSWPALHRRPERSYLRAMIPEPLLGVLGHYWM